MLKTFYHIAIAFGLTASLASLNLSAQIESPKRQATPVVINKSDAYWLGRTSLAYLWHK